MKTYITVHGPAHRIDADTYQPGFISSGPAKVKAPPADPKLAIPDPLKPRLKKVESNDEAEARFQLQRKLIDSFKRENPGVSVNKMFETLSQQNPGVFVDDVGDDDEVDDVPTLDVKGADEKRRLNAKKAVIDHYRSAFPELPIDEVYHRLARLNPEYFQD